MTNDLKPLKAALYAAVESGNTAELVALVRAARSAGTDLRDWWLDAAHLAIIESSVPVLAALGQAGLAWSDRLAGQEPADEPATQADAFLCQALYSGITTPQVVRFLLARGADPNRRWSGSPLLGGFFCRSADVDIAVLNTFLEAAPEINAVDADGASALMHAAGRDGSGRVEALELLLARGADPWLRDRQGRTAADHAAAISNSSYLKVLQRQGKPAPGDGGPQEFAATIPALDMPGGSFFVLEPIGTPLSLRWVSREATAEAAFAFIESRFGTSRPPIGPFPVFQRVSDADAKRNADPFAARQAGKIKPGDLAVLALTAVASADPYDAAHTDPRPIFVVSAVFKASDRAAAQAFAQTQTGWSCVAQLISLTMMSDGYADPVADLQTG